MFHSPIIIHITTTSWQIKHYLLINLCNFDRNDYVVHQKQPNKMWINFKPHIIVNKHRFGAPSCGRWSFLLSPCVSEIINTFFCNVCLYVAFAAELALGCNTKDAIMAVSGWKMDEWAGQVDRWDKEVLWEAVRPGFVWPSTAGRLIADGKLRLPWTF